MILRKHRLGLAVVALLALAAGLALSLALRTQPDQSAVDGLFALELPDAHGQPVRLAAFRGQPVLINFWGTWCPPCREEMPLLDAAAKRYAGKVAFVGIAIDTPEAVRDYLRQHPTGYPLPIGDYGLIQLTSGLGNAAGTLPFTLVIDAQGRVLVRHQGAIRAEELDKMLAPVAG